ncbi:MAG TPA: flavodoxin domain-containing protein [Rhodanobacteraceae bacterium]|nr:flavodoxin domain-containing protein [Rhodanobacteraceae bacterium]
MGMFDANWFRHRIGSDRILPPTGGAGRLRERPAKPLPGRVPLLLACATQTGVAEELARRTLRQLKAAGVAVRLANFDAVRLEMLQASERALFIASTSFDGDPPDMADEFCQRQMASPASLHGLRYGLLALGDANYREFCGFGMHLQRWLQMSGARPLFDPVMVDDEDPAALQLWRRQVNACIRAPAGRLAVHRNACRGGKGDR